MLKKLFIILCVIIAATAVSCSKTENIPGHELDLDLTDEIKTTEPETMEEVIDDYTDETKEQSQPETEPPIIDTWNDMYASRYEDYDNPNLGFKIQYPAEWTCIDADISPQEFNEMILYLLGSEAAVGLLNDIDMSASALMWYDFGNTDDLIMPCANLVISDSGDITQDDFQSPMNLMELQNQFDNYYPLILDGFESGGIFGQLLGENYFAIYNYSYSDGNNISSCYQAITEKNGFLYTFTFTVHGGESDIEAYEKTLSTMIFY